MVFKTKYDKCLKLVDEKFYVAYAERHFVEAPADIVKGPYDTWKKA